MFSSLSLIASAVASIRPQVILRYAFNVEDIVSIVRSVIEEVAGKHDGWEKVLLCTPSLKPYS